MNNLFNYRPKDEYDQTYVPKFSTTKDGEMSFKQSANKRQPLEPDGKKIVHQRHDGPSSFSDKNASEEDANNDDDGFDRERFWLPPAQLPKVRMMSTPKHRQTLSE